MIPWFLLAGLIFVLSWLPGVVSLLGEESNPWHLLLMIVGLVLSGLATVPVFLLANLNRQLRKYEPRARQWQSFWSVVNFFFIPFVGTIMHIVALYFMFYDVKSKASLHASSRDHTARQGVILGIATVMFGVALIGSSTILVKDLQSKGYSYDVVDMIQQLKRGLAERNIQLPIKEQKKKKKEKSLKREYKPQSIIEAVRRNQARWVYTYLEQGDNINQRTLVGETPLMEASAFGFLDMVKLLVDQGADLNLRNPRGETALTLAKVNMRQDVIGFLKTRGAEE